MSSAQFSHASFSLPLPVAVFPPLHFASKWSTGEPIMGVQPPLHLSDKWSTGETIRGGRGGQGGETKRRSCRAVGGRKIFYKPVSKSAVALSALSDRTSVPAFDAETFPA